MGQYFPAAEESDSVRVLVEHEPGIPAIRSRLRLCNGVSKIGMYGNLLAWKKFEPTVLKKAAAVVVFTEADRHHVLSLYPEATVWCIPFGTELPESYSSAGSGRNVVTFVGNYIHYPNIEAAERLLRSIYPGLVKYIPNVELQLIGEHPTREMISARGKNVKITGYAPDIALCLRDTDVFVAPLSSGGGMRVKMAQAFAHGKAVVATSLAVAGLPVKPNDHYLPAETDDEFVDAIAWLLRNEQERAQMGCRARRAVDAGLKWTNCIARYDELYDHLLSTTSLGSHSRTRA